MQNLPRRNPWYITLPVAFYAVMLWLYPARFRRDFGDEMRFVFAQSLDAAARRGGFWLVTVVLGEFIDYPLNLLREYIYAFTHHPIAAIDLTLYRARWITRLTSAAISGFLVLVSIGDAPQDMGDLLALVLHSIIFVSVMIAWRWEITGGIVLLTSAFTIVVIYAHAFALSTGLVVLAILSSVIWALPHIVAGMMFIALGRRALRLRTIANPPS